jgi:hypothetical protein
MPEQTMMVKCIFNAADIQLTFLADLQQRKRAFGGLQSLKAAALMNHITIIKIPLHYIFAGLAELSSIKGWLSCFFSPLIGCKMVHTDLASATDS